MKAVILAALATLATAVPVFALERCSTQEIRRDSNNKRCDDLGFRRVLADPQGLDVVAWARAMKLHEQLVVKAIQITDVDELRRQAIELRSRSSDPSSWPDEDQWTLARVSCATMAQELANFVDDKLKGTARGEVAAEASLKAYRAAGPDCRRGIQKLK
jgi:hypothetical protein